MTKWAPWLWVTQIHSTIGQNIYDLSNVVVHLLQHSFIEWVQPRFSEDKNSANKEWNLMQVDSAEN